MSSSLQSTALRLGFMCFGASGGVGASWFQLRRARCIHLFPAVHRVMSSYQPEISSDVSICMETGQYYILGSPPPTHPCFQSLLLNSHQTPLHGSGAQERTTRLRVQNKTWLQTLGKEQSKLGSLTFHQILVKYQVMTQK